MSRKTFVSPGTGIPGKNKPELLCIDLVAKVFTAALWLLCLKNNIKLFAAQCWITTNNFAIINLLILHRTKLDRKYRMETLHTLEAVFCDPCKNQVRFFLCFPPSVILKSGPVPFPAQRSLVGSAQDSSCWWTRKGRHCELWSSSKRKGFLMLKNYLLSSLKFLLARQKTDPITT